MNMDFFDWATENTWEKTLGKKRPLLDVLIEKGLPRTFIPPVERNLSEYLIYAAILQALPAPGRLLPMLLRNAKSPPSDESRDDDAELFATMLAAQYLASIVPLKPGSTATPDLEGITLHGQRVEIEIKNARRKQHQQDMYEKADKILQLLMGHPKFQQTTLWIENRFDPSNDLAAVCTALDNVDTSQSIPLDFDVFRIQAGNQPMLSLKGDFAGPIGFTNNIIFPLQFDQYTNAINDKQDARQASGTCPYVVMHDMTNLPGGVKAFLKGFSFRDWSNNVSAIWIFAVGLPLPYLRFEHALIVNPNALIGLPAGFPTDGQIHPTELDLGLS
jgi:hypothetical protein